MSGRKLHPDFEHPLDNIFIDISDKISPLFRTLKMTPNMITFISLIFGILAIYSLYKDHPIAFAIFYLISHWADCADGFFARKYKMTSKFGDYFDHIKDVIVFVGILIVFIIKFKQCLTWYEWLLIGLIVSIAAFGMARQLGCQEIFYNKKKNSAESGSLSFNTKLCKGVDPEKEMRSRKWLGCGAFILVIILIVIITYITGRCD
jgi:phosphatidylglycerophosphate synthase